MNKRGKAAGSAGKKTEQELLVRKDTFDKVLGKLIQTKPVKRGRVKAGTSK